ncbi:tetratricopeptide repeat protein [Aphanothece hegewaldii]|uniref:tetratricopeptide repeat protein n=1 Tax=Aphanothece hegewaldii TaxID=1521625 RepID=UPI001FE4956A|nr:hypothetical protein [Aphanothece hegewaldii]
MYSNQPSSLNPTKILLLICAVILSASPVFAQSSNKKPSSNPTPAPTSASPSTPENTESLRPLAQSDSILNFQGAQQIMQDATNAINAGKYDSAVDKLQQARRVFNQLSNFHLQLANSFSGIDNKIVEAQRQNALQTGQMRDEATYQLALVHRAQNKPELAVPLLIQVIQSQNPTSELGKKSYQQLYELGFVSAPFSTNPEPAASTPNK